VGGGLSSEAPDREIGVRVLIYMAADLYEPDNPYLLIAREVKKSGGQVIDDPDLGAVAAHKGKFHKLLVEHNIPVPETVIVPRSELETFRITDEIKAYVGEPFVVKPGWGGGGLGVNVDGHTEEDLRRSAELAPSSDSFLIQKRLKPVELEGHIGWFRVFTCWGRLFLAGGSRRAISINWLLQCNGACTNWTL
jgi:glutathione synthase/RimK-type ligase-like ATP-grasp enzyme